MLRGSWILIFISFAAIAGLDSVQFAESKEPSINEVRKDNHAAHRTRPHQAVSQTRDSTDIHSQRMHIQIADRGDDRLTELEQDFWHRHPKFNHGNQNAYSLYNLGLLNCRNKRYPRAVEWLNAAAEAAPRFAPAYYLRGLVHFELQDFHRALSDLEQTFSLMPDDWHVEIFRDRTAVCIRSGAQCDSKMVDQCRWYLRVGSRGPALLNLGRREESRGPPDYLPKNGPFLPPLE